MDWGFLFYLVNNYLQRKSTRMNCNLYELLSSMQATKFPRTNKQNLLKVIEEKNKKKNILRNVSLVYTDNCQNNEEPFDKMTSTSDNLLIFIKETLSFIKTCLHCGLSIKIHLNNILKRNAKKTLNKSIVFPNCKSGKDIQDFLIIMTLMNEFKNNIYSSHRVNTVRDIYYRNVELYNKQQLVCNKWITLLSSCLNVDKFDLGIVASQKGLFYYGGKLKIEYTNSKNKRETKCFTGSNMIPYCFENYLNFNMKIKTETQPFGLHQPQMLESSQQQSIKGVAILEKDAIFSDLVFNSSYIQNNGWLLVTGKGYPDRLTQTFIKYLRSQIELNIKKFYIFVDSDPYGINIAYKYYMFLETLRIEAPIIQLLKVEYRGVHLLELLENSIYIPNQSNSFKNIVDNTANRSFRLMVLSKRDFRMSQCLLTRLSTIESEKQVTVIKTFQQELQRQMFFNMKGEINTIHSNNFVKWFSHKLD